VQTRPITTLFPIPSATDGKKHVYVSVGHQQMMTDAMKPLGLSLFQLSARGTMQEAGGRLFVDVAERLASPATGPALRKLFRRSDPLLSDAIDTLFERGDFGAPAPDEPAPGAAPNANSLPADPAIVAELIARSQESIAQLKRDIQGKTGTELLDFVAADIAELQRVLFDPQSFQAIMAGMEATWWLNEQLEIWLGEKNAADTLTQSVANNITSQMGLALMDVADAIRPHRGVVAFLQQVRNDNFLDDLDRLPGGTEARTAIAGFLDQYGMRGAGEIDITRPRWSERPSALLPAILGNVKSFEAGAGVRHFEEGRRNAAQREQELLERLRALPDGARKAEETQRMILRLRTFIGYREYPKYAKITRYFVYKQALMQEAERMEEARVIGDREDIFYLTLPELQEVARTNRADDALIRKRKDDFRWHESLTPPRVLTSDGEAINGAYRRSDLPSGALPGLAVSAGTVEGRARIILDMAKADLEPDDILVTAFTDPSWTPLFVAIRGLVTEVGGLMTHGAVIAREYGLPAVVGVVGATRRIRDGQRIRVHGTDGYVEIL
jgi:pyruvate,water dikinase